MSFSGKNDDITLLTVVDRPGDRLFPIRYLDVFTIRFFDAGPDVRNNVQWFLETWVIGCDDRQIRKSSGDFSHLKSSGSCTVSAAPEQTYQSLWMIFF